MSCKTRIVSLVDKRLLRKETNIKLNMQEGLGALFIIVFPFFFILVMIGFISVAKRLRFGFRMRSAFARFFLWLERSGLFEREDEREEKEIAV